MQFRKYEMNQLLLLPRDMKERLHEGYLVYFIVDVIRRFYLSSIYEVYDGARGDLPPYDPRMMMSIIIYAY